MKHLYLFAIITLFGASISPATEAMLGATNAIGGYVTGTAGWTFTPTTDISVTSLGVFDSIFTNPNEGPIAVGLWNQSGSLLSSSSVASNSFLLNNTRYEPVAPTFLAAGLTFYIGVYAPAGTIVLGGEDPVNGGSLAMSPEIQIGMAVVNPNSFGFPNTSAGDPGSALIAPNFQFVDSVPEPSAGGLFILGAALFVKNRMKRTTAKQI